MDARRRIAWWSAAAAYPLVFVVADFAHWPRPVYAPIEHAWAFGLKVPGALVSMHLFGKIFWAAIGGATGYLIGLAARRVLSVDAAKGIEKYLAAAVVAIFVVAAAIYMVENLDATPVPLTLPDTPTAG